MSFSFLGGLASLLPGYLQGQRQAVQDNWNDLLKYNQTREGQLSNLFTEATWQPRLDTVFDAAHNSSLNTIQNIMNTGKMAAWLPYETNMGRAFSDLSTIIGPQNAWMAYQANQTAINDPWAALMMQARGSGRMPQMGGMFAQTPTAAGGGYI